MSGTLDHAQGAALVPHVASGRIVDGVAEHLTVGRVAELTGVTVRTLHHYDETGLVQPSSRTAAGYRAYSARDVERLREVLAYRRLGFGLREIAALVNDPATDAVAHLRRLRVLLMDQRDRAAAMVTAIDRELGARAMGIRTTPEEQLRVVGPEAERRAVASLSEDLSSGRWAEHNRELVSLDEAELGLRLLVA